MPAQLSHFAKPVCVEVAYARVRTASGSDRIMPTAFPLTTIHLLKVALYDPVAPLAVLTRSCKLRLDEMPC